MSEANSHENTPTRRGRRIGRRVGQGVYYSVVLFICVSVTWQITQQVFFPDAALAAADSISCEQGLSQLLAGIEDAKRAADRQVGDADEEAALNRFRAAISATWVGRDSLADKCQAPEHKRLLDAMDRLRYSEEHGVRKQAAELAALRWRVGQMAAEVLHKQAP